MCIVVVKTNLLCDSEILLLRTDTQCVSEHECFCILMKHSLRIVVTVNELIWFTQLLFVRAVKLDFNILVELRVQFILSYCALLFLDFYLYIRAYSLGIRLSPGGLSTFC